MHVHASHGGQDAQATPNLALLDAAERAEFLSDLGLAEPGLNRVIRSAYRLLGL